MLQPKYRPPALPRGIVVAHARAVHDAQVWRGGSCAWDWTETGTRHVPGIQPADTQELLDRGCDALVLSKGMDEVLQTPPSTLAFLAERGIDVYHLQSNAAAEKFNTLFAAGRNVGGLFHSTC